MSLVRDHLSHAIQKAVREHCVLNAALNYPTTNQNCKLREICLTAFKTQLNSTFSLFHYERPLLSSAGKTLVCDAAVLWKSEEDVYHDCDKKRAAPSGENDSLELGSLVATQPGLCVWWQTLLGKGDAVMPCPGLFLFDFVPSPSFWANILSGDAQTSCTLQKFTVNCIVIHGSF